MIELSVLEIERLFYVVVAESTKKTINNEVEL